MSPEGWDDNSRSGKYGTLALIGQRGSRDSGVSRITVSRKITPLATQRNLWKRRIREVLKRHESMIPTGYKVAYRVCRPGKAPGFALLEEEMIGLLRSRE